MMPLRKMQDVKAARRPAEKAPARERLVEKYKRLGIASVAAAAAMVRRQEAR